MTIKELKEKWKDIANIEPSPFPKIINTCGEPHWIGDIVKANDKSIIVYADNPWFEGSSVLNVKNIYEKLRAYDDSLEVILGDENCELWKSAPLEECSLHLICTRENYVSLY